MADTIQSPEHTVAIPELQSDKPHWKSLLRPVVHSAFFSGIIPLIVPRVKIDGQVYDIPSRMSPVDFFNLVRGRYENPEISLLHNLAPADTIIEIGANIGVVARHAFLDTLKEGGTYICVEPNPHSQTALNKNMERAQRHHLSKSFQIIQAAVCAPRKQGKHDFVARTTLGSGLSSHINRAAGEATIPVCAHSLSSLASEFAPKGYTLIMDAEGAEIDVINLDSKALHKVDQMVIELHQPELTGRNVTPHEMLSKLRKLGFNVEAQASDSYFLRRTAPANIPG